jgi:hypothetical protein
MIEERTAALDHFEKVPFNRPLSQGLIVIHVANELSAQCPQIVDVFLNRLGRQVRCCPILKERTEQGDQFLARRQMFFQPPSMSAAKYSDLGSNVPGRDAEATHDFL